MRGRRFFAAGLLAAAAAVSATLLLGDRQVPTPVVAGQPAWLTKELGGSGEAPLRRRPLPGSVAEVGAGGYRLERGATSLALQALNVPGGAWQRHVNGYARTTPFGRETVTVASQRVEQYLTVHERQGPTTWRWQIDASARPVLQGGSVFVGTRDMLQIEPVRIFDAHKRDVTPAGLEWGLQRGKGAWYLTLSLDDAKLPLPYVIDPASTYPSAVYQRSTQTNFGGAVAGSGAFLTAVGTSTNSTTKVTPSTGSTGNYQFQPSATNSTSAAIAATSTDVKGWMQGVNTGGAGTGVTFPAGTWTIAAQTRHTGADTVGCAHLVVGMWAGNVTGTTTWSNGTTLIDPTTAGAEIGGTSCTNDDANDVFASNGSYKSFALSTSLASFQLGTATVAPTNQRTIIIRYYLKVYTVPSGGNVEMPVDSPLSTTGVSAIGQRVVHPAAATISMTAQDELTGAQYQSFDSTANPKRIWFNPNQAGSFKLRVNATDTAGTVSSESFPGWSITNWTATAGAGSLESGSTYKSTNTYSWDGTVTTVGGPGFRSVSVVNSGGFTATEYLTIDPDANAPTGGVVSYPDGYDADGSVTITKTDATDADSGILSTVIQRQTVTLSNGTCGAFAAWPTGATTVTSPDTVTTGTCARYRLLATDNVGNTATFDPAGSPVVKFDSTAPSAPTPTLTENPADPDQLVSGTTLYYRPGANGGTFTVSAAPSDGESGILNVAFPTIAGASITGTNPDTTDPYSVDYTWDNTLSATGAQTLTATNGSNAATNNTTATFTLTQDTGVPSTTTTFPTNGGTYNATGWTDSITGTAADSGGSGLARVELSLRQDAGNYYGGSSFDQVGETYLAATGTTSWSYALADTKLANGSTYTLHVRAVDNVGNVESFQTFTFSYDTSAPTGVSIALTNDSPASSSFKSGNDVFYRGVALGQFQLSTSATDSPAGVASATTTTVSTGTFSHTGSTVSSGSPVTSGTFSWTANGGTPNANGTTNVTVTDAAGNTTGATTLTFKDDSAAATTTMTCDGSSCNAAPPYANSVTVALSANDGAGSGVTRNTTGFGQIRYTTDGGTPTTSSTLYTGSFAWTTLGTTTFKFRSWDNVGNLESVGTVTIEVTSDATPPTIDSVVLSSVTGGAFKSGNTVYYRGASAGSVKLTAQVTDNESGPASISTTSIAAGTFTHTGATQSTGSGTAPTKTYETVNAFSWTADTADQTTDVKAKDVATNESAATTITFRADSDLPTSPNLTSPSAGAKITNGTALSAAPVDSGSGLASVQFFYCSGACNPFSGGTSIGTDTSSAGGWTVTWTGQPADGVYTIGARTTDNVGNAVNSATVSVTVDNTPPTSTLSVVESGTNQDRTFFKPATDTLYFNPPAAGTADFKLASAAGDATAGIQSVAFPTLFGEAGGTVTSATGPWQSATYTIASGDTAPADQNVVVTDQAGNALNDVVSFALDSTGPASVTLDNLGLQLPSPPGTFNNKLRPGSTVAITTGNPTDAGAGVARVEFYACPGTDGCTFASGDKTLLGTDTSADYSVTLPDLGADGQYQVFARAFDNVGNGTDSAAATVTYDETAPATTIGITDTVAADEAAARTELVSTGAHAYTLYFSRGTSSYVFRLTSTITGADVGNEGDAAFPDVDGGTTAGVTNNAVTDTLAPFSSGDVTIATNADQPGPLTITTRDAAGNPTTDTVTFVLDTSPPSPAPGITTPGPGGSGVVKTGTSIALWQVPADGQSGIAKVDFFACPGTDGCLPTDGDAITLTGSPDTDGGDGYTAAWPAGPADGTYQLVARATNRAGLTTDSTPLTVVDDDTRPTQALSLTSVSPAGSAVKSGNTVFYRGSVAGSLVLRSTVTDTNPASATFAKTAGANLTLANDGAARTTPGSGTYDSGSLSWNGTSGGTVDATATDAAGNTTLAATTLTFTNDSTAPTAPISCNAGACSTNWYAANVTVTFTPDDGAGAGGTQVYYTTDGSAPTTASTLYSGGFTLSDGDRTLRWIAVDAVGNTSSTGSQQIRVDTSAPAAPSSLAFSGLTNASVTGTTVFIGPGAGGFTVGVSASDAGSGIKHVTFPGPGAGFTPATSQNDTTAPYSQAYTFGAATAAPGGSQNITATNNADATSGNTAFTIVADSGAPTLTVQCNGIACSGSTYTSAVSLTASASDAGSGGATVRYTTNGSAPTTSSPVFPGGGVSVTTTTTFRLLAVDAVGNQTTQTVTINVDSSAPTLSSSALATGNSIALTFSETLAAVTPANASFTVEVGGVARTVTGVSVSGAVVTLTFGGAAATSTSVVNFSYLGEITNPLQDGAGNQVAPIGSTAVGGTGASPAPAAAAPPSTPEITSTPASPTNSSTATFTFGSAGASSFECSVDGGGFAACASPATVTGLGSGTHSFSVRGVGAGGTGPASSFTWTVDVDGPSLTKIQGPAALTVDTGPLFEWGSSESNVTFLCRVDGGAASGCVSPKSIEGLALGDHTFEVWGSDALGNRGASVSWSFEVIAPATGGSGGGSAPTEIAEERVVSGVAGIVWSPDRSSSLEWPAMATDDLLMTLAEPTLRLQPVPGLDTTMLVDANAIRLSTGEKVTQFDASVLRIVIGPATSPLAVYTSDDDGRTWTPVPYFTEPALPAGLRHGAKVEDGKLVVYTRHLSLWATIADAVAPTAPAASGSVVAGGLRLSWAPSVDNVAVARYLIVVDGKAVAAYDAATTQADLGALSPDDARTFQVAAEDGAGNRSALSAPLRSVPSVATLALDQARAALQARGLAVGTVTERDSSQPSGTVIAQVPAAPALAAQGQAVDLIVARSASGAAKFVLKVAAAKTVPLKVRRTVNVRIQVTRRANIVAVLRSPANVRLYTWKRSVRAGASILRLKLPATIRRSGAYTLAIWASGVGERQRVVKRLRIRIVGENATTLGPKASAPRSQVEVVLAGGSALKLNSRYRVTVARSTSAVFDRATARRRVDVLVVNVERAGLGLVREFHAVFPEVPIVGVVSAPASRGPARTAGASAVLVRGEPIAPALLRLLG